MPLHRLLILSRPQPGRENAYNEWYTQRHLQDVLSLEGFRSAQRFSVNEAAADGPSLPPFGAIYEVESDDLETTFQQLAERFSSDQEVQDLLDFSTLRTVVLTPISERVES